MAFTLAEILSSEAPLVMERRRHCDGKIAYLSIAAADKAWREIVAGGANPLTLQGYFCRYCTFIHLGRSAHPESERRAVQLPSRQNTAS